MKHTVKNPTVAAYRRPKPPVFTDLKSGELFTFADPDEGKPDEVYMKTDEGTFVRLSDGMEESEGNFCSEPEDIEIFRVKHKPIEFEIIPNP